MRDTITMPAHDFQTNKGIIWHKHDEIAYNHQMFDIKTTKAIGDTIYLIGHYDKFENKLFKTLNKLFERSRDNKHGKDAGTFWFIDAIVNLHHYCLKYFQRIHVIYPVKRIFFFKNPSLQLTNPPPEFHSFCL